MQKKITLFLDYFFFIRHAVTDTVHENLFSMDIPLIKWVEVCTKYHFCLHSEDGARVRGLANQAYINMVRIVKKNYVVSGLVVFLNAMQS